MSEAQRPDSAARQTEPPSQSQEADQRDAVEKIQSLPILATRSETETAEMPGNLRIEYLIELLRCHERCDGG